jgi:hypothetical protein
MVSEQGKVGVKHDAGKNRWDLLPIRETLEVVKVFTHGCKKYAPWNWQFVVKEKGGVDRVYAAAMRHIADWRMGKQYDNEGPNPSGLHHLAHAICDLMMLIWYDFNVLIIPAALMKAANKIKQLKELQVLPASIKTTNLTKLKKIPATERQAGRESSKGNTSVKKSIPGKIASHLSRRK